MGVPLRAATVEAVQSFDTLWERAELFKNMDVFLAIGSGKAVLASEIHALGNVSRGYRQLLRELADLGLVQRLAGATLYNAKPYILTPLGRGVYKRYTHLKPVAVDRARWSPHQYLRRAIRNAYRRFKEEGVTVQFNGWSARLDHVLHKGRAWVVAEAETGSNDDAFLRHNLEKILAKRDEIVNARPRVVVTLLWLAKNVAVKKRLESLASGQKEVLVRTLHELERWGVGGNAEQNGCG